MVLALNEDCINVEQFVGGSGGLCKSLSGIVCTVYIMYTCSDHSASQLFWVIYFHFYIQVPNNEDYVQIGRSGGGLGLHAKDMGLWRILYCLHLVCLF